MTAGPLLHRSGGQRRRFPDAILFASLALAMVPVPPARRAGGRARPRHRCNGRSRTRSAGKVQFELSHRSRAFLTTSRPIALADLRRAGLAQLGASAGTQVHFQLVREAGSFDCQGVVFRRRGTGDCRFLADSAFAAGLARRGMGQATDYQLFSMAMGDIGLAYADELERQHYSRPTVDQLVEAGNHGAGIDYLRAMGGLGYRVGTVSALVRMRDPECRRFCLSWSERPSQASGETLSRCAITFSPPYIAASRPRLRELPVRELIGLRDHGVSADFVRQQPTTACAGYRSMSYPPRDHGLRRLSRPLPLRIQGLRRTRSRLRVGSSSYSASSLFG